MKIRKPSKLLSPLVLLSILTGYQHALAQSTQVIFDDTLTLKAARLSDTEQTLLQNKILPAAANAWSEREREREGECMPDSTAKTAIDVATGSFTKPQARQKAILYDYCMTGHNMALNGIAIVENDQVVAHIIYEGGWDHAIGALPDIDDDGLAEILVATGGTSQGITWGVISILELPGGEIRKLGQTATLSDNCGTAGDKCWMEASRISVRVGKKPVFYREVFVEPDTGARKKLRGPVPIALDEIKVDYEKIQ